MLRMYRIAEPSEYYFDEVYHAVTAKGYADNNRDAYDPYSQAPMEGTAYDWLHPPFAKLIQAGSIKILGDDPLGWRFPSVIFGTALIPATFVLAFLIFGPTVAVFAAIVIAFENLTFVMSRITMNDIFLTFFVVTSFIFGYLYVKKKSFKHLFLTALFLGLAVASKWSGIYAIAVVSTFIAINNFKEKSLNPKLLLLIFIPFMIYIASYSQYFLLGFLPGDMLNLHKQIWWYQNRSDLEHSYGTTSLFCVPNGLESTKSWCPWALNIRPVYFSYEDYGNNKAGYIYALGNPLVFWLGVMAVAYMSVKFLQTRSMKMLLILLGYFIFWVPWIFTPRLLFLYHYLPAIPFMAIALGYEFRDIYKGKYRYAALFLIFVIILSFIFFYPISSGYPIETDSINRYMWLPTWR